MLPTLYKGAGPGTHWHQHDPRCLPDGFTPGQTPASINAVVRHITSYSFPSAYLSFSTSFAVARSYALSGPSGLASASMPGYVYEVDLYAMDFLPSFVDPVRKISSESGDFAHRHNGDSALIVEIAKGATSFGQSRQCGGSMLAPAVSPNLRALIFSIRDAEVLIGGNVAAVAIINRRRVF